MKRTGRIAIGAAILVIASAAWWLRDRRAAAPAPGAAAASQPSTGRSERPQRGEPGEPPRAMIDDDPRGSLRLEGQVIDADDHPVGGATVVLASNPPRTLLSEADGSFAFDGLVARPYTLAARAARGVAGPITARLTEKSDPVVLRLHPAAALTVAVVGLGGAAISGATVELRGIEARRAVTRDGPAVFSPVAPGGYQIAAWADGMAHAFQFIQIGHGDAQARLVLTAGAPVSGRVVDDRGAGIAGARVRYSGASDWTQQASARHDAAITGSDGGFRFDALPAGSFRFLASHPERAPGSSPLITLDGKTARDGVVIALEVGAVVRGRVVDAQRHPVASARVRIGAARAPGGPGGPGGPGAGRGGDPPRQAFSDADGGFEIRGLPRRALSAVALHDTGASQAVAVDASRGDVSGVWLVLDITGAIAGVVVDPAGQPVEGAQVTALPAGGMFGGRGGPGGVDPSQMMLRGLPEDVSDSSGRFRLTGLASGEYRLSASPSTRTGPRRGGFRDAVIAETGDESVKLVLQPEGSVKGKVAFADGSAPELFTVAVPPSQQSFVGGGGAFQLDGIAPGSYQLEVRGPSFQNTAVRVAIPAAGVADAGTITVVKGRAIAGFVVADGQPVPDATVYAGRQVMGNGSTTAPSNGPIAQQFGGGTKTATTDASGAFSLSGFGEGDLTLIADHEAIGRSRALRLPMVMPGQTELTLVLEKYGALTGVLRQGGQPAPGVMVTCQAVATPGALFSVAAGPDGAYRFDRLAPDTYKVSASVGNPRSGIKFYSRQIDVPSGQQVVLDLTVDPGTVGLDVAVTTATGPIGVAWAWLVTGGLAAATASELSLRVAGAGAGASSFMIINNGQPAAFTEVAPGDHTVCVVPLPGEVRGLAARGYVDRHADSLAAFCRPVAVAAAPATQTVQLVVALPPYIPDAPGSGGGSGSGSGSGSGITTPL